ncbi:MAG: RNA-binding transcriptional accessory protein [Melioribacteraceae bacterium]|nr:RNA-binding transcriptional accessory protein [Melioribacteraceae bacterium]
MNIPLHISKEISLTEQQVLAAIGLLQEGATIPFIARYRKERTNGLDEEQLRTIDEKLNYLTILEERKEAVLKSIDEQGKLTEQLKHKIINSVKLQEVEDLYLPFRPKRKTRATIAKAKGLEPLALFIIENPDFVGDFEKVLMKYVDKEKEIYTVEDALQGAKDIIAEMISDDADVRKIVREYLLHNSTIHSQKTSAKKVSRAANVKDVYEVYHDFKIEIKKIKPYQILALNRGEREKFLKISLGFEKDGLLLSIKKQFFNMKDSFFNDLLSNVVDDSFTRLIFPSIEREVRNHLTETADIHAIDVFASNLRQLLLQPPISGKIIMGIDPGFFSGSKVAVIDSTGKYLEGKTIYPHPPQSDITNAEKILLELIKKHSVNVIAIGNGTASRETESLVAEIIKENSLGCHYIIVNESGASVYSASPVAKEEFPELEASQRGNISIARRLLDPLAELVKIDPKSIGVGLYQHDVDQKYLSKKLDDVVESCVNYVGVDVNTASASLLTYVSGMNKRIAKNFIKYKESRGSFKSRKEFLEVTGVGDKLFEQCAGFLKITKGENPLDNTFIHPESYGAVEQLLKHCNIPLYEVNKSGEPVSLFVNQKGLSETAKMIGIGEPTLTDIIVNLRKPGRDPREEMPRPILRSDVLTMEDLRIGMSLKGTVRNVVDFGAFVDIGVKQDGLLHISQIADRFIKNPLEVLSVGDIINVKITSIDTEKGRIGLSMKN